MPQFRKKAKTISAEQFKGVGWYESRNHPYPAGVCFCLGGSGQNEDEGKTILHAHVHTMHNDGKSTVLLEVGDWIIPEPDGKHYYPCKPGVFADTYEPVDEEEEVRRHVADTYAAEARAADEAEEPKPRHPDYIYEDTDPEGTTFTWEQRDQLVDIIEPEPNTVYSVKTVNEGPEMYFVKVLVDDDDPEYSIYETQWFYSKDEAEAATAEAT